MKPVKGDATKSQYRSDPENIPSIDSLREALKMAYAVRDYEKKHSPPDDIEENAVQIANQDIQRIKDNLALAQQLADKERQLRRGQRPQQ